MAIRRLRGMVALKRWREAQAPPVEHADLAKRVACHPDQLRHFEAGRRALPIPVAIPLHHITAIAVEDLLTRRQVKTWARMAPATHASSLAPSDAEPTPADGAAA